MITAAQRSKLNDVEADLHQTQARLDRLERHEWWRWGLAFVVMLALTVGLIVLSIPVVAGQDPAEQVQMNIGLRGLLGLVLLFDVFVVHQQVLITRLRRDLATQLRVVTTLEILKRPDEESNRDREERRRIQRSGLDRRLRVNTLHEGKPSFVLGRIRDISEDGLGAVIPCSLNVGDEVTLEFSVDEGQEGSVSAVVRHRQGFHYGFDFVSIAPSMRQAIARMTAVPVA